MWVDKDRDKITGRRNIIVGESITGIPPHVLTKYTGEKPIGTDPSGFESTDEDCPGREARVCRVFTSPTPRRAGGLSYTGIGFAACTHEGCSFVVPVTIDDQDRLVIMHDSANRT